MSLKSSKGNIKRFLVPRYNKINVSGYEIFINSVEKKFVKLDASFTDIASIIIQHEIDHHEGILISEIGKEVEVC